MAAEESRRLIRSRRGLTLVELMVVVTIIAILAAIGSVAYSRYVKSAKVEKLKSIAMEIASGQERYRSRNNVYYPASGGTANYSASSSGDFKNLLDFSRSVPEGVGIQTESWSGTNNCGLCGSSGAPTGGSMGFAVKVTQDLAPPADTKTEVYVTGATEAPIVLNEGE